LPVPYFEAANLSGVNRNGIYRVGRLFGRWDVYFVPGVVNETSAALEMLCVGQSEQAHATPSFLAMFLAR
jgi:hypothetical protein